MPEYRKPHTHTHIHTGMHIGMFAMSVSMHIGMFAMNVSMHISCGFPYEDFSTGFPEDSRKHPEGPAPLLYAPPHRWHVIVLAGFSACIVVFILVSIRICCG